MTLDEAIKEFTDWAKDNRNEQNFWAAERDENDETNPLSYADCEGLARDAETRAEYHEQLAEWLRELKEAKRLLKAAINDFELPKDCRICNPKKAWNCIPDKIQCLPDGLFKEFEWRHKAEALKLIGETNDEP